ncbi:MAG: hypothetical protein WC515_06200 [Candidatus Omnitrophota bacterium]
MKKGLVISMIVMVFTGLVLILKMGLMPQVEGVISDFHQRYNDGEFGYIYREMASGQFREALPYGPYEEFMNKLRDRFGKVVKAERTGWGVFYKNIGSTFNLRYRTVYERGELEENFTLLKHGSGWRILTYDAGSGK